MQLDVAETLDHWTKPREGLSEDPLTNLEEIWYIDGSSFVLDGKRRAWYAVVSHQVNQLQHAVPVQQRYKTTADHRKYHTPLDTAIRTLRLETSKRGRPNTPRNPSSAGSSQKDLDAPIPKELGILEGGMLGR